MVVDANGLHIIPPQDSLALVARHLPHIGRVALPDDDGPLVLPVNYRVVDDTVVFRTGPGSRLAAAAGGLRVAFESTRSTTRGRRAGAC